MDRRPRGIRAYPAIASGTCVQLPPERSDGKLALDASVAAWCERLGKIGLAGNHVINLKLGLQAARLANGEGTT
jgi:hypothetical protein